MQTKPTKADRTLNQHWHKLKEKDAYLQITPETLDCKQTSRPFKLLQKFGLYRLQQPTLEGDWVRKLIDYVF